MKIIVNRNKLYQAALHAQCYTKSNGFPIYKNMLKLVVDGSHLTVSGSDGLMFKTEQIDLCQKCKDNPRTFCLNSIKFIKAIKSLSDQPLELLIEEYQITVHHSDGYFRLPVFFEDQLPEPRTLTDENIMHLHTEAPGLRSQLSKVVYATADDELRPVMCGILMEIENNSLVYVASDGHILVRLIKKCQEDNGFISSFILPHDAVNALLKILPPTGYCELYFQNPVGSNKRPMCKAVINDTTSILFECIDGRYPNYKNVIPTDFTHSFTVDRRHLLKILDRISLFAPNSREIKIQMLADGNIELKSRNIDEDSMSAEKISYSVIHKTSSMCDRIYVNVKLLIKLLRNINGELVQFNLTDQNRAFTICPVPGSDVEDLTALLMPIYNDEDY